MVLKPGIAPFLSVGKVWKKIKSHGTQTQGVFIIKNCWVWKKIKLHGTQTHATPKGHLKGSKITGYSNRACFLSNGSQTG
jgi:hypothetical protein